MGGRAMAREKRKQQATAVARERLYGRVSRIAGLFVLGIFVVQPIIITNGYYNITYTKLVMFTLLICSALICSVGAWLYEWTLGNKLKPEWKELAKSIRPFEWAILAYLLALLISTLFSTEPLVAWLGSSLRSEGFLMQSGYMLTVLFVSRFYKFKERDLLLYCCVAGALSVHAALQYFGYDIFNLNVSYEKGFYGPQLTFMSTMSNRNMFSPYLCMAFLISAVQFSHKTKRQHWAYLPIALITFFTLMLNNTDSGYVGILAAVALGFPFVAKDRKTTARLMFVGAGSLAMAWLFNFAYSKVCEPEFGPSVISAFAPYLLYGAVLLAAVGAAFYYINIKGFPKISQKAWRIAWAGVLVLILVAGLISLPILAEKTQHPLLVEAGNLLHGELTDSMGSGRGFIWKRAFALALERPIIGHGPDSFDRVFFDHYGAEAREVMGVRFDKIHNEYLQLFFDEGILGLGCMLAFFALGLWYARKSLGRAIPTALVLSLICMCVQSFFSFSTPFAHPIIYAMWGVLMVVSSEDHKPAPTAESAAA